MLQLGSSQPWLSWNKVFAFPELKTTLACKIPFGSCFVGCINSKHVCTEQIYILQKAKANSNSWCIIYSALKTVCTIKNVISAKCAVDYCWLSRRMMHKKNLKSSAQLYELPKKKMNFTVIRVRTKYVVTKQANEKWENAKLDVFYIRNCSLKKTFQIKKTN